MTDEDIGGHSWAELKQGSNEMTLLFRGYSNQKPPNAMSEFKPTHEVDRIFTGSAFVETKPFFVSFPVSIAVFLSLVLERCDNKSVRQ